MKLSDNCRGFLSLAILPPFKKVEVGILANNASKTEPLVVRFHRIPSRNQTAYGIETLV
jgi:hypothetical protein